MNDQAPPTLEGLQRQILELHITALKKDVEDHETRIRNLETVATRSNVLFALATGGGLISIITLIRLFQSL